MLCFGVVIAMIVEASWCIMVVWFFCLSRFEEWSRSKCVRSPYYSVDFPVDLKRDTGVLVPKIDRSRFFLGATPIFVSKLKLLLGDSGGWKSTLSRKTSRKPTSKFVSDFVRRQSKNRLVPLRSGIHYHTPLRHAFFAKIPWCPTPPHQWAKHTATLKYGLSSNINEEKK